VVIKVILRRLDNRIVCASVSNTFDLNRDRGSSGSTLYILLLILRDVRRCARLLHNINIEEKKRKDEDKNRRRIVLLVFINVLRLKHYYLAIKLLQDDINDHESISNW